jgi:SAM-dependent methyltransferase
MDWLICNPSDTDPRLVELRTKLDAFYARPAHYPAFEQPANKTSDWQTMNGAIAGLLERKPLIRVLELGAGRTAFPSHLGDRRSAVDFHVQDITPINGDYLAAHADVVHIADISQLTGTYDLIYSTYVFEHVTNPRSFLEHVDRLLAPGGWHFLFCPRYDNPFYICPSLRHRSRRCQAIVTAKLLRSRLAVALTGRPAFWINCDPSLFYLPWRRDNDAIHLVSRQSVELWHRRMGYSVRRVSPRMNTAKEQVFVSLARLSVGFQKPQG